MIVKIFQDDNYKIVDNLKLMDNFEQATIIISISSANLALRNDSLSFSRESITLSTSTANIALRNITFILTGNNHSLYISR